MHIKIDDIDSVLERLDELIKVSKLALEELAYIERDNIDLTGTRQDIIKRLEEVLYKCT